MKVTSVPLFASLLVLALSAAAVMCQSQRVFVKLAAPAKDKAGLYILRSFNPTWGWRNFEARVLQYDGHFSDSVPRPLRTLVFENGDYLFTQLPEGFYRLELPKYDGTFTIVRLKAGQTSFVELFLYAPEAMSIVRPAFREVSPSAAVEQLIDGNRMNRHAASED